MQNQSSKNYTENFGVDGSRVLETDQVFARARSDGGQRRFFVSFLTDGVESGQMRNKWSPDQPEALRNRTVARSGKDLYELKEVPEESFDCYLDFLERGDNKSLRNAERVAR